jgi:hypothetical protein
MAAEHILHMQKALSQMNLQLHHVLSDITGTSGQAILDAILSGKRDPVELARLCHGGCLGTCLLALPVRMAESRTPRHSSLSYTLYCITSRNTLR